jgi:hypothetical protein
LTGGLIEEKLFSVTQAVNEFQSHAIFLREPKKWILIQFNTVYMFTAQNIILFQRRIK